MECFSAFFYAQKDRSKVLKIVLDRLDEILKFFEKQNFFQLAQSLSDEIQAFVNASAGDKLNKDEVMNGLRGLLGKYPALKDSSFTEFIQNIIISESESNLSILLSPEEAAALWI